MSAVLLGVWLAALGPAFYWAGPAAVEGLSWAALLCLVPGWAVMLIVHKADARRRQVLGILAGTGLRLAAVLTGAVAVAVLRPELRVKEFFVWLAVFYPVALLVETRMLFPSSTESREAGDV